MKKIVLSFVIVLVLLVGLALLAPFVVDLNKYKDTILKQIEPYVPRTVDFQHIELTIFTGLGAEIQGLTVSDNPAFPGENFVTLDSLQVRLRVLPLLKKQIKVKKVVVDRPVVRLARNAEGVFNFSDLAGGEKKGSETDPASLPNPEAGQPAQASVSASPPDPDQPKESAGGPWYLSGLLVNELEIDKGKVIYQDEVLFPGVRPFVIDELDLAVKDLSLQRPVSVELAANLLESSGQNIRLTGVVGPVGEGFLVEKIPMDFNISLESLPLEKIQGDVTKGLPFQLLSGALSLKVDAKGSLGEEILSEAEVDIEDLVLQASDKKDPAEKTGKLHVTFTQKSGFEYTKQRVELESAALSLNRNRILLKGTLESLFESPRWDVKAWTEDFHPYALVSLFPMFSQGLPSELEWEGPAEIKVQSAGSMENLHLEARVDLNSARIRYKDLFHKAAGTPLSLDCNGDKEAAHYTLKDLQFILHHLVMNVSGEIVTEKKKRFGLLAQTRPVSLKGWDSLVPILSPYHLDGSFFLRSSIRGSPDDASMNAQVSSDRIAFRLPPSETQKKSGADGNPGILESVAVEVQAKKKSEEIRGTGKVEVKKGEVMAVSFERFLSSIRYVPDQVKITGLELRVFQGSVRGSGLYNMQNKGWLFKPVIKGIKVEQALDKLSEYKNLFSGTFSGDFQAEGSAQEGKQDALQANGKFRIAKGELKNFDMLGSVLNALFQVKGVSEFLSGSRSEVKEHDTTRFEWLEGTFSMKGKKLRLDPLQLHDVSTSHTTDSDVLMEGNVALDADLMDMKGKVILSERHSRDLAREAEVMKALLNSEKRMVLPFTLKGSIQKPVPFLDTEYVVGAVSRYYTRKGVEKGLEQLQKELGWPKDKKEGSKEPVEDLLKGLFR